MPTVPQRPALLFHSSTEPEWMVKVPRGGWRWTSVMRHLPSMFKDLGSHQKKKISTGHFEKKMKRSMCIALLYKITKDHHQTNQMHDNTPSHLRACGPDTHNRVWPGQIQASTYEILALMSVAYPVCTMNISSVLHSTLEQVVLHITPIRATSAHAHWALAALGQSHVCNSIYWKQLAMYNTDSCNPTQHHSERGLKF